MLGRFNRGDVNSRSGGMEAMAGAEPGSMAAAHSRHERRAA
jgi:hypothetical protein